MTESEVQQLKAVMENGFEKLDNRLEGFGEQVMNILTGKDVVDKDLVKDLVKELLAQQAKSYQKILTIVTTILSAVIIVILGLKQFAPHILGGI